MKKIISLFLIVCIILTATSVLQLNANEKSGDENLHQIAILDVMSSSMAESTKRVLTDVLRTEIFKLHLFKIVERGVIQDVLREHKMNDAGFIKDHDLLKVGKFLAVERLFVMIIEKFGDSVSLNVRVIDVNTTLVEYTENVFIQNDKRIFEAIEEIVKKVELFYSIKSEEGSPQSIFDKRKKLWNLLGATQDEAEFLLDRKLDTEDYLSLRQYDITFTISEYIEILKNGWDTKKIKSFLQSDIPYPQIKQALSMGIVNLENFDQTYRRAGFTFEEYLDAYKNHIASVDEYKKYKKGYKKDHCVISLGYVADIIPITKASFSKYIIQLGWEHFYTKYQRGIFKVSSAMGLYILQPFVPGPYFKVNLYVGKHPYYFKVGNGVFFDFIIGGHVGYELSVGMEFMSRFFWDARWVWGTQPNVSFKDGKTKRGDPDYKEIDFPYYMIAFGVKF